MLNKIAGLARALGIILAVAAAFAAIPGPVALIILLFGLVAGLLYGPEDFVRLAMLALVLPLAGPALGLIPTIGTYLTNIFANVAIGVAGALATCIILRLCQVVVNDLTGLAKPDPASPAETRAVA